jgi:hypothetical protein
VKLNWATLYITVHYADSAKQQSTALSTTPRSSQLKRVSSLALAHDVGACSGVVPHLGAHLAELCSIEGGHMV